MLFPDEVLVPADPDHLHERLKHLGCVLMDAGWSGVVPTTVVDLCEEEPELLRSGLGEWEVS